MSSQGRLVRKRHEQLAAKYRRHEDTIEAAWKHFDAAERKSCIVEEAADGNVLEHPTDESKGDAWKILPEWNIHDLTTGPDCLLELLEIRSYYEPADLVKAGLNGGPGDRDLIEEAMNSKGLRSKDSYTNDSYCLLADDTTYGKAVVIPQSLKQAQGLLAMAQMGGICVPQAIGDLILERQLDLLSHLNRIVDIIVKHHASFKEEKREADPPVESSPPPKFDVLRSQTVNGVTVQTTGDPNCEDDWAWPLPLSIERPRAILRGTRTMADMVGIARDQVCAREEFLYLFSEEPDADVFGLAVDDMFVSIPQRVPDEKGRTHAVREETDLSSAVFEAAQHAFKGAVIWCYVRILLDVINEPATDKAYRGILLQELVNVCHLEYARAQGYLRRHVQTGTGDKWFKRIANVHNKDGSPRVKLKGTPEKLVPSDAHLQCLLRLCQPETSAPKAIDWMDKLGKMHKEHPVDRTMLDDTEAASLSELAFVVAFIRDLASVVPLPSVSHKTGQVFISKLAELDAELGAIKKKVDRASFLTSAEDLREPGTAEAALKTLDEDYIIKDAGSEMGHLYHDLLGDSYSDLQAQYRAKRDKTEWVQSASSSQPPEKRIEERRQRDRTRRKHCKYPIAPHVESDLSNGMQTVEVAAAPKYGFAAESCWALSALFDESESAYEVEWAGFTHGMHLMGFAMQTNFNSVCTFYPPEGMASETPVTVHQPHGPCFDEEVIPILARRLRKAYGWSEVTFPPQHGESEDMNEYGGEDEDEDYDDDDEDIDEHDIEEYEDGYSSDCVCGERWECKKCGGGGEDGSEYGSDDGDEIVQKSLS